MYLFRYAEVPMTPTGAGKPTADGTTPSAIPSTPYLSSLGNLGK
jgi:hypothetical protein